MKNINLCCGKVCKVGLTNNTYQCIKCLEVIVINNIVPY